MNITDTEKAGSAHILKLAEERLAENGITYKSITWGENLQKYMLMVETDKGWARKQFGRFSINEYDDPVTQGLIQGHITLLINKIKQSMG